jgi:hypothetical protein
LGFFSSPVAQTDKTVRVAEGCYSFPEPLLLDNCEQLYGAKFCRILSNIGRCYSLFGFLLGSTLAGASVYYYILEEYKVSNEMLTEDIYVRVFFNFPAELPIQYTGAHRWLRSPGHS